MTVAGCARQRRRSDGPSRPRRRTFDPSVGKTEPARRGDRNGREGFVDLPDGDIRRAVARAIEQLRAAIAGVNAMYGESHATSRARRSSRAVRTRAARPNSHRRAPSRPLHRSRPERSPAVTVPLARADAASPSLRGSHRRARLRRDRRPTCGCSPVTNGAYAAKVERNSLRRLVLPYFCEAPAAAGTRTRPCRGSRSTTTLSLALLATLTARSRRRNGRRLAARPAPMAFVRERSCSSRVSPSSGRDLAALRRHRHREILIPETIVDHRVDQRAVAKTISPARVAQQIRRVRHRFHAAGADDCARAPALIARIALTIASIPTRRLCSRCRPSPFWRAPL